MSTSYILRGLRMDIPRGRILPMRTVLRFPSQQYLLFYPFAQEISECLDRRESSICATFPLHEGY